MGSIILFGITTLGFLAHSGFLTNTKKEEEEEQEEKTMTKNMAEAPKFQVVFILGGPGSGKGTQCEKITQKYKNWVHLSAGDLLRAERKKSNSELSKIINTNIAEGKIVPSEITVQLLYNAMIEEYNKEQKTMNFLIDGFPRNEGNVNAWNDKEELKNSAVKFVLFFDCSEEIMMSRLVQRGKNSGRNDDEVEVIRKRFNTYTNESMPIIEMYEKEGLLKKISADKSIDDVFTEVSALF